MSKDMSMFKKMKDRITDEVNSATSKLQNMQIMDQLTSSISQQMIMGDMGPNQLLPEPDKSGNFIDLSSTNDNANKFSLINDSSPVGVYNEEEELNTETSPQHQLFNEHSIIRTNRSNQVSKGNAETSNNNKHFPKSTIETKPQSVITNINDLNSDIEDDHEDNLDIEIDLLSDKPIETCKDGNETNKNYLMRYRQKYKTLVHTIKKMNQEFMDDKSLFEAQKTQLNNEINALKSEMRDRQQLNNSSQYSPFDSISTNVSSEKDDKSSVGSPQPTSKTSQKLKDLERLLSKCKESLKQKNEQIQILKDALMEVDKFKDSNQLLRKELAELRGAHERWTVSIAENKRVMHQEIENKNLEMEKVKKESSDLLIKLNDSNTKIRQMKSAIQDLESRLVSTSAAHMKERESLIKELTLSKNAAIRSLQQEHEHNLEKVKLELEKSIEALKSEILNKDQQIVRNAELQQLSEQREKTMSEELQLSNQKLERINTLENEIESLNLKISQQSKGEEDAKTTVQELQNEKEALINQIIELKQQINSINDNKHEYSVHNSTEFEYLKNIVYQFMLGKQPLVLARVISAVLKFDKEQIDQVCKVQEIVETTLGHGT